ncbi:uncharacterized protein LOC105162756 [Sesamum indicum]|uniref:Uncharacterized protein LOC105162756 n=1 Tax=Sesamum indicum TaxID=4182 RepID=A0A6I9T5J9_SESIN|nr:uncharacterized protein LOC105162756 [Sesamum indicum]
MGDFNCIKSPDEKQLGVAPTWYELKDFVDCCTTLGLLDIPTTGCYYTCAHFNPPGCLSDHSPGIVSIFDPAPTKPKPFRFFNMWADHLDFLATVEARWNLSMEGTPQFSLCRRLKALKGALKAFNIQHYNHISARAKEAELTLQVAQNQLESNPGDVALRDSLGDLRKKAVFLAEAERHFFYQKAKIHYLKEGDRNTKFFHDMSSLITTSLLGTEAHTLPVDDGVFEWGPIISPEHTADLCRAVTPLEVKEAIFHISDNKAPGPDGYSSCFFKKAWNIVGDQVCRAVLDFFRSGRMLRQLNHTIITLVPKSNHSTSVADYRSISCCNVIYKAITKIISDRLAPALEHLIDRYQAAFVGGRNIIDNIFLAQEMVQQYSRKRISPRLALNGSLHGFFSGKKGLRQGDPISPTLFLLSMEYFSRLVKRKTSTLDFNFHPKCEKLKMTHLLFADDLMLFSCGDLPSIHILMECLQEFRDTSGLTVNTSKSSIFTAGIQNEELDGILARTKFARGEMPADWNLFAQLFRGWSATGSKFSHFQRRSSRKSTDFAGVFYGTLGEHRSLGRKSAIPRKKVESVFGTYSFGTWLYLLVYYGTSIARQTRCGCSGSTVSTLEMHQSGTGNRRRGILHSFNGLPKSATGWSLNLDLQRQRLNK